MYALIWLLAVWVVWLSLRLNQKGVGRWTAVCWILASVAGLLTHYFFLPIWCVCVCWLALYRGRLTIQALTACVALTMVAVTPWYVRAPMYLGAWHITGGWLYLDPGVSRVRLFVQLPLSYLSGAGYWGGPRWAWWFGGVMSVAVGAVLVWQLRWRLFCDRYLLVLMWLGAALAPPILLDLTLGTYLTGVERYAIAGLPAAMLCVGIAVSTLPRALTIGCVALILVAWMGPTRSILRNRFPAEPTARIASILNQNHRDGDLLIVHSIPSGPLALSRSLDPSLPMLSWVGPLGRRSVPEDMIALAGGVRRIVLVTYHQVRDPVPEAAWLREHSAGNEVVSSGISRIQYFPIGSAAER